jgi:hypothetical protein
VSAAEPAWATRFRAKVDLGGPPPERRPELGPCHVWTGADNGNGYGRFWAPPRYVLAHRAALELAGIEIPSGYVVDHLCRNPACVNAEHLEPVTQRVNIMRGDQPNMTAACLGRCQRGHAFDEGNTYIRPSGEKNCRTCRADSDRLAWIRRKARA